jgi:F-type H+-transporting ATPase subunit delta
MADAKVAKRYACALFGAAKAADVVTAVEADLNAVANQIANDERFREFLLAPYVAREDKAKILDKIFSDRVTALTMSALRLMLQKRREEDLVHVRDEFVVLRREYQKKVFVLVSSAEILSDTQRTQIEQKLEKLTGEDIEPEFRVDPTLVGGVKVQYGDYVLDGTIRGALRRLRDRLRIDVLKQTV